MSVVLAFATPAADPSDEAWLRDATRFAAFAGPDAQRWWASGGVGLGHAALHTSLDAASLQPLSLDDRVWLSADVRLDDRAALRRALVAQGRRVPSDADDARLVLDAYLAWGEACVDHLAGDFAFALWDGRAQTLFCARDQMGVAPLYYANFGDRIVVASAIDALRLSERVTDDLDERTVGDFLISAHSYDVAASIYADIRQLPPAHALVWRAGRTTVRRYWDVPEWDGFVPLTTPGDYVDAFRAALLEAVADRTRCSHVGMQLSGGLDSTTIAALATQTARRSSTPVALRAYTGTLRSVMAEREGEYAALVADALGISIEWIDIAACDDVDPLESPAFATPEPSLYQRTDAEREFATRPAAHGRVVLTGLGGDILLRTAPSYWLDWLAAGEVRRTLGAFTSHVRTFGRPPVPGLRSAVRHIGARRVDDTAPIPDWIEPSFARRTELQERRRVLRAAHKREGHAPELARWPYWSALLGAGHPAFTGSAVRFVHPFFDLRLLELALALPPRPWLIDKRILRDAATELLPERVRTRPKTVLPAPAWEALRERRGVQANVLELIDVAPGLERYVDRACLREASRHTQLPDRRQVRAHAATLGFAHWLQHRRRPRAAGVGGARSNAVERHAIAVP